MKTASLPVTAALTISSAPARWRTTGQSFMIAGGTNIALDPGQFT